MIWPKISLIIPNYQGAATLPETIASVTRQKYPGQIEVIVVDNASTDNIRSVLTRNTLTPKTIYLKENVGFAAAFNRGLKQASGQIIATGNNDVVYHPDCFRFLIKTLQSDPRTGLAGPKICDYTHRSRIVMPGFRLNPWLGFINYDHTPTNRHISVMNLSGCTLFIKKAVLDKIGSLDEHFFFYFEDTDFCWRAKQAGYRLIYQPQALAFHHLGSSSKKTLSPYQTKLYWYIGKLLMVSRHASLPQQLVYFITQIPALLIKNIFLHDRSWSPFINAFSRIYKNR